MGWFCCWYSTLEGGEKVRDHHGLVLLLRERNRERETQRKRDPVRVRVWSSPYGTPRVSAGL